MAPRPRFEKLSEEKRAAILKAAAAEFGANGFAGASYNRIIAASGVSKGAMYYYFDDKKDLFRTTLTGVVQAFLETLHEMPEIRSAEDFWAALQQLGHAGMEEWTARPEVAGLFYAAEELRATGDWTDQDEAMMVGEGMPWFDDIYDTGQRVGAIRTDLPDDFLKRLLWQIGKAQDTWLAQHSQDYSPEELADIMRKYLEIWRRICAPEEEK